MKYSLRSLFVVVTLICVVLGGVMGRVEYLRRWAVYHERRMKEEEIVSGPGPGRTFPWWHHQMMARKFREAMSCPWVIVTEPTEDDP